jgi:hypothetical protein
LNNNQLNQNDSIKAILFFLILKLFFFSLVRQRIHPLDQKQTKQIKNNSATELKQLVPKRSKLKN